MGFLYVVPFNMTNCTIFTLFRTLKWMILMPLGLIKSSSSREEEEARDSPEPPPPTNHVLLTEGLNPTLDTVSAHALAPLIKKKLPVVEYGDFLERFKDVLDEDSDHSHFHSVCAVCLEAIEKSQEIRELSKCCHVFHRECLDTWVDRSQMTCPLCRSLLISVKEGERET